MRKWLPLLIIALAVVAQTDTVGVFLQDMGTGVVDWTHMVIKATGIGGVPPDAPPSAARRLAMRAAELDALRNILETVKGVYIDAQTTVENAMVTSDVIHAKVEGVIRGFKKTDVRYMSDGSVEIDVEVSLGDIAGVLLPPEMGGMNPITSPVQGGMYTGLVVDARGLGVQPAMAPKILTPDGIEVYGTGYVSREYAVDMGIVGYARSIEQARRDERVGPNPLVVKAIKVEGPNKTDVVISHEDAMKIHRYSEHLSFLEKCRVIFVID